MKLLIVAKKIELIITEDFHLSSYVVQREMETGLRGEAFYLKGVNEEIKRKVNHHDVQIPGTERGNFAETFAQAFRQADKLPRVPVNMGQEARVGMKPILSSRAG